MDPELAAALDATESRPRSRARLIRDLALRGARAEADERRRARLATGHLLAVARGETDYDPKTALEAHAEREASTG